MLPTFLIEKLLKYQFFIYEVQPKEKL